MKRRFLLLCFAASLLRFAPLLPSLHATDPPEDGVDVTTPEAGGEDLRIETRHGPIHIWRPANYDSHTAGIVIYVHGYMTTLDQTWNADQLAVQFHESGRNALFIAIEAPQSNIEDVFWDSVGDLLTTVGEHLPYSLPRGPLVVAGHSAAYRTLLPWLNDARIRYIILLDALYGGEAEFHYWLHPGPHTKPHRMVLVSYETWWLSNHFARRIYGTARRKGIPPRAAMFSARERRARLLYVRSQYDHNAMINSGKVIPVLLQISPLGALPVPKKKPARRPAAQISDSTE